MVAREQALQVAREDGERAYGSLEAYKVEARLVDGRWFVDYELADPALQGGGPHYEIDAESGEILSKRYEQ
jgi:hypothetical protein